MSHRRSSNSPEVAAHRHWQVNLIGFTGGGWRRIEIADAVRLSRCNGPASPMSLAHSEGEVSRRVRTAARLTLPNEEMTPLFAAAIEETEKAVYNSLFRAVTTTGSGRTVEALPLDRALEILRRHGAIGKKE